MQEHEEWHLLSAFIDGELSAAQRRLVEKHLPFCASCRDELEGFSTFKARLARAPRRAVPPEILADLERRFGPSPLSRVWEAILALPRFHVTAQAMAAAALLIGLWAGVRARKQEEIPLAPLLAAHARYSGESLVSQDSLVASNFSTELALSKGEEE